MLILVVRSYLCPNIFYNSVLCKNKRAVWLALYVCCSALRRPGSLSVQTTSPDLETERARPNINDVRLSIFYSIILPRVCRTLVPEICVCPEMLRVFQYIDMLMCVIYNCAYSKEDE